jgi:hypothetical protein
VKSGQWTDDTRQKSEDSEPWTVRYVVDIGQGTRDTGQLHGTVDTGQWTRDSEQGTVDKGQWTRNSRHGTVDLGHGTHLWLNITV